MKKIVLFLFLIFLCKAAFADSEVYNVEKPFLEGKYEEAVSEADKLIDRGAGQRYEVYYLKGLSLLKLNRFKEARDSFQIITDKYTRSARAFDAYIGIGDTYFLEGRTSEALRAYKDAKDKFPSAQNEVLVNYKIEECKKRGASDISAYTPPVVPMINTTPPAGAPVKTLPKESATYISVQVGYFKNKKNAEKIADKLYSSGYKSYIDVDPSPDKMYRVKVGKLSSKAEAESLAARLNRDGYKTKICDGNTCQ